MGDVFKFNMLEPPEDFGSFKLSNVLESGFDQVADFFLVPPVTFEMQFCSPTYRSVCLSVFSLVAGRRVLAMTLSENQRLRFFRYTTAATTPITATTTTIAEMITTAPNP